MAIPVIIGYGLSAVGSASTAYIVADFFGVTPDAFQSYWDETSETVSTFFNKESEAYVPGRRGKYSRSPASGHKPSATNRRGRKSKSQTEINSSDIVSKSFDKVDRNLDTVSDFASTHGDSIEKIALLSAAISPNTAKAGAAVILLSDILSGTYSSRSNEANPSSLLDKVKPILTTLAVGEIASRL